MYIHSGRRIILSRHPHVARRIVSGGRVATTKKRGLIMMGDIVYVYATRPEKSIIGEFVAGQTIFLPVEKAREAAERGEYWLHPEDTAYLRGSGMVEIIPALWPRSYKEPIGLDEIRLADPGFRPPRTYRILPVSSPLIGLLEERRCYAEPRTVAVIYGVPECRFCRETLSLLREIFGRRCVSECDISMEDCFDRYEELLEELFPGGKGIPLTLGAYGDKLWAAYGGLNIYDMESIYNLLQETPRGGLLAYSSRGYRLYRDSKTLSKTSLNTL